jgi:hypothetical protein
MSVEENEYEYFANSFTKDQNDQPSHALLLFCLDS